MRPTKSSRVLLAGLSSVVLATSAAFLVHRIEEPAEQRSTVLSLSERAANRKAFSSDDRVGILIGGLTGVFLGWRLGKLPRSFRWTTGWRGRKEPYVTLVAAPMPLQLWMFSKRHSDNQTRSDETVRSEIQTRSDETIRSLEWNIEPLAPMPEFTSAAEFVQSALNQAGLKPATLVPEGLAPEPSNDGTNMAMFGGPSGGGYGPMGAGGGGLGRSRGPPGSLAPPEFIFTAPHMAVKQGDKEPEFLPRTNYDWYSENRIADLEEHISNVRKYRQELAQEAEYVWAWLAVKEAEHREKFPVTRKKEEGDPDPSPECTSSSIFCQSLNQVHSTIWRKASDCDWMIADSQKRIAQEKSRTSDGKIPWRPSCSKDAARSPLKSTLKTLKDTAEVQTMLKSQMEQGLSSLAMGMGDPSADLNQITMHPMKGKMAPLKEVVEDIREVTEKQLQAVQMLEKTLKEAIAEVEERVGKGKR